MQTSSPLFPNLYVFLIGHPGVGKTRSIREARKLFMDLPEFHLAPTSMTFPALTDALGAAKRHIPRIGHPDGNLEYNSLFICTDELGAFMHAWDQQMSDGLSALYDPDPYGQTRRTKEVKLKIQSPQLNILCGSTPQNLAAFMPEKAWGQGFSTRIIMVFSDERIIGDDFAPIVETPNGALKHDLAIINGLVGEFTVTKGFADKVNEWRRRGCPPVPSHPKLIHYVTRRYVHLYKLAMVSAVDRSNSLSILAEDFDRAYNWLIEAEQQIHEIFKAGATNADGMAMDEIHHFVLINDNEKGISEQRIVHFAKERIPITSILRVVEIMEKSGMIRCVKMDRQGLRHFRANKIDQIDPLASIN